MGPRGFELRKFAAFSDAGSYEQKTLAIVPIALCCLTFSQNRISRNRTMSQHPSFKAGGGGNKKKRNVLKRFERVSLLKKRGQWKTGDRVSGLVKTKPEE